jgi:hypothetical protein
MFVSAIAALSIVPFERRTTVATPTVAQSWARRVNFTYDQPAGQSFGTRISASTLAARTAHDHVSVERRQNRRQVGRRIAVRNRTADRPAVSHLRIADQARRVRDDRHVLLHERIVLEVVVTRQRSDRELLARVPHVAKVADATDVDEQRRPREPQAQQRDQRMSAREELRVVARAEQLDRLLDGLGDFVVERRRDHDVTSFNARHTRSGVAGISMSVMPRVAKASTTAFITAAVEAIVPVSPTPFTPSGFVGLGVSVLPSSNDGTSAAEGTR